MYIVVLKQDLWCPQLKLEPVVNVYFCRHIKVTNGKKEGPNLIKLGIKLPSSVNVRKYTCFLSLFLKKKYGGRRVKEESSNFTVFSSSLHFNTYGTEKDKGLFPIFDFVRSLL